MKSHFTAPFFMYFYLFNKLKTLMNTAAVCALVEIPFGLSVSAVIPLIMPLPAAYCIAETA